MAKIFVVEDDLALKALYRDVIFITSKHEIILEAGSLEDALKLVPQAIAFGCNAALIDGSLDPRFPNVDHGAQVAEELKKISPDIWIVSYSASKKDWGRVNLQKPVSRKEMLAAFDTI